MTENVSVAHIDQLKADISALIVAEGKRSFWSGLATNTVFFVLGLAGGVALDLLKAGGMRWF